MAVINFYSEFLESFKYDIVINSFFHALILLMGIFLIVMGIRHLNKSKKYINDKGERDFADFLIKINSFLPFLLLSDGFGFLLYEIYAPSLVTLSQPFFLLFYAMVGLVSILLLYTTHLIAKHAKNINLTNFLNTIS